MAGVGRGVPTRTDVDYHEHGPRRSGAALADALLRGLPADRSGRPGGGDQWSGRWCNRAGAASRAGASPAARALSAGGPLAACKRVIAYVPFQASADSLASHLTALGIARETGMILGTNPSVIIGDELRHLSNTQLQLALDAPEILFARVSADQKTRIVAALKRKRHIVAVTGDGVNDAPALKKADIGIVMGRNGTDVAREAADIVLLDDNFASIVAAIEEGRAVFANIRKFLTYILTSNIPELVPYVCFVLFKIPLPLTIIQILAVDLGTDMLPALALGAEPSRPDTMRLPPRRRHERLLDWRLMLRAYLWLGLMQAAGAMTAFFFVLKGGGWSPGQMPGNKDLLYLQATTACLTTIVVMQIANLFLCRHPSESVFRTRFLSNPLIFAGILFELILILLIDYTSVGNQLFGTASIPFTVWLLAAGLALGMFVLEELRKAVQRRMMKSAT